MPAERARVKTSPLAADPESERGKPHEARELKIPTVTEAKLPELVDGHP